MSTEELLAQALRLSRPERARVAEELLSSLEEPDDEEGRVRTTGWETARTDILKEFEERRARRTAS